MIASILSYLEKHTYLLYALLTLLTVITLLLTLLPSDHLIDARVFRYDKLGHMLMFGAWTFLLGIIQLVSNKKPLPLVTIFIAGSLFGITVEILQEVLPVDRSMDPYDALADITGCLIAVLFLKVITTFSSYDNKPMEQ